MNMRKWSVCGIAGIILAASVVMPVSAHGHHHSQTSTDTTKETTKNMICEVCTVEGCRKSGLHVHDDVTYCGYDHEDGYCDGSCGAVEVCTVEGCEETGRHTHNQETYCGYAHESGYCDHSCARTAGSRTGKHYGGRRHHAE